MAKVAKANRTSAWLNRRISVAATHLLVCLPPLSWLSAFDAAKSTDALMLPMKSFVVARPFSATTARRQVFPYQDRMPCTHGMALISSLSDSQRRSVTGIIHDTTTEGEVGVIVSLFTKDGCTLCDKVKEVMLEAKHHLPPHLFRAVDITDSDQVQYYNKYKYDIPVVHINGFYWAKHRLTIQQVKDAFQAVKTGSFASPPGEPNALAMEQAAAQRKNSE
jgi:thiol-disulfide isomerase/thioredoxin